MLLIPDMPASNFESLTSLVIVNLQGVIRIDVVCPALRLDPRVPTLPLKRPCALALQCLAAGILASDSSHRHTTTPPKHSAPTR